jgi:hypothetical protein
MMDDNDDAEFAFITENINAFTVDVVRMLTKMSTKMICVDNDVEKSRAWQNILDRYDVDMTKLLALARRPEEDVAAEMKLLVARMDASRSSISNNDLGTSPSDVDVGTQQRRLMDKFNQRYDMLEKLGWHMERRGDSELMTVTPPENHISVTDRWCSTWNLFIRETLDVARHRTSTMVWVPDHFWSDVDVDGEINRQKRADKAAAAEKAAAPVDVASKKRRAKAL